MAMDLPVGRRRLVGALLVLTAVTGLIDAVSYLRMGHVFVANMTGNVVFLGLALEPGSGLSLLASAVAIGGFLAGAVVGGRMGVHLAERPGPGCAPPSPSRRRSSPRSPCSADSAS